MTGQPNIVFLMADQMAAPALPVHGNRVCRTPNLNARVDATKARSRFPTVPAAPPDRVSAAK